jgi:PKD repeat protein
MGLRNPFRIAVDPNEPQTQLYIADVGARKWEEINLGRAGADYGWDTREGHCAVNSTTNCGTVPGLDNPLYAYGRSNGCTSITGGSFVPNGIWPAEYDGAYLFGDYVCGIIFQLIPTDTGMTAAPFITNIGGNSLVHIIFGPHGSGQALYYVNIGNGQIHRVSYTGRANRRPMAAFSANPTSGLTPLRVTFDGSDSSDPDNNALTYFWNFGDGSRSEGSNSTTTHTYNLSGTFSASLVVRDSNGSNSEAKTRTITVGNRAPTAVIDTPSSAVRFAVGQQITLHGSATDPEEGVLANNRLTWEVLLHHESHTHPLLGPTIGNDIVLTMPAPEDIFAAANSYLELRLTATDAMGLRSTVVTQDLRPALIPLTLASDPPGVSLTLIGGVPETFVAPQTFIAWPNYQFQIIAPETQIASNGQLMVFQSWSDGEPATHHITTPFVATTYTAIYRPQASIPPSQAWEITLPLVVN